MSDSHGLEPSRLPCPWNFPGKNTGVGCHFLLQRVFSIQVLNPSLLVSRPESPALTGGFFTSWATREAPIWSPEGPVMLPSSLSCNLINFLNFFFLVLCSSRRQWHPTPVLLPGKSHGRRSLVGCSPWGREESGTTERLHFHFSLSCIGEGNGNPLQCSCLENPRDRGA